MLTIYSGRIIVANSRDCSSYHFVLHHYQNMNAGIDQQYYIFNVTFSSLLLFLLPARVFVIAFSILCIVLRENIIFEILTIFIMSKENFFYTFPRCNCTRYLNKLIQSHNKYQN